MHYIGDPEQQIEDWQYQGLPDNCAVAAQTSIINQFDTGHLSVNEADYIAQANGWYAPGSGTPSEDVGKLFDMYDIPYHQVDHAGIDQLANELQEGHRVIVGVNSSDLWQQGPGAEFCNWFLKETGLDTAQFNPADHAVAVTGINVSDPAHPAVVLNDPGDPHGAGIQYPLDRFMDAWKNSDFHYVATDSAPPGGLIPGFDVGTFLGIGATAIAAANGLDLPTAADAGAMVATVCDKVDWDQILTAL